jgi:hypothetical protein
MFDARDLRPTIVPKSDQLNSEQLLTGSMTIKVTGVTVSASAEQPVTIHYENDDGRPYKPCKTMRKVLILAWGHDGSEWAGRSMTLYNDPAVKFGGQSVGGIRISEMSDMKDGRPVTMALTASKKARALYTVKPLVMPAAQQPAKHRPLACQCGSADPAQNRHRPYRHGDRYPRRGIHRESGILSPLHRLRQPQGAIDR